MKKNSYIKFLLTLLLVLGSLAGCQPNNSSDKPPGTQPEQAKTSQPAEKITIDTAYNKFKYVQTKFLENLKAAVNNEQVQPSTKSNNVAQQIEEMQTAINNFQTEELPKINSLNKESVTQILAEIDKNLKEISDKVIAPLKNGLTKNSVEEVQRQLDFFQAKQIPEKNYGNFSTTTYQEIENFLLVKSRFLENKIKDFNSQKLSAKVIFLEEENSNLKKTSYITLGFALLATLISLLKGTKITSRKARKGRSIGNLFKRQTTEQEEEKLEIANIDGERNLVAPLDEQQVYEKNYYVELQKLNRKNSDLIQQIQIDKRNTQTTVNNLNKRIEELETRFQKYLPQERREQSQARIQTWQSPQPTRNQSSVVSAPQVSNFSTSQWIDTYNHDPSLLSKNATEVSETEDSVGKRHLGKSQAVILETKRRGNYWILTEGGYHYLAPSQYLRINEHNYKTVEALFECRNYHPDSSDNFRLLKLAVVYPLSSGQTWQLQEPGILQF